MAKLKMRGALSRGQIACRAVAALLTLLLLIQLVYTLAVTPDDDKLYVHVLDVGQSDAILLRCGDLVMLIDTGTATEQEALQTALLYYGVSKIDYLVLTHLHEDHIGNARYLLSQYAVGQVLLPQVADGELAATLLQEALATGHVPVTVAEPLTAFAFGAAACRILYAPTQSDSEDLNNDSLVLHVSFGDNRLLFMGDGEEQLEQRLLSSTDAAFLDCDFLKVGHHGAKASACNDFLAAVTPQYAVISCGKNNSHGFPHADTLARLSAAGATVYRTDESGTLSFGCDGTTIFSIREGGIAYE